MRKVVVIAMLACAGCSAIMGSNPPSTFVRTANEAGTWRSIDVDKDLQSDKGRQWSILVDALSSKYDLEVLDKESGYLRTSWKFIAINGKRTETYRSRVVAKFNQGWTVLQIKAETQWLHGEGWEDGFDSAQLRDVQGDLQGRLGRTRQ